VPKRTRKEANQTIEIKFLLRQHINSFTIRPALHHGRNAKQKLRTGEGEASELFYPQQGLETFSRTLMGIKT
jgi:hypothetical protein